MQQLVAGRNVLCSGMVQALAVPDESRQHAEALFQPFTEADFPMQLDSTRLAELLARAPEYLVPATLLDPSIWPSSLPPLFKPPPRSQHHGKLVVRLLRALEAEWPRGIASELLYTPYWNDIGFTLPEFVGNMLEQGIIIHQNVEDNTVTTAGSRRDFFVTLNGVLLVGGEDKTFAALLKVAVEECEDKHKGANAALYGRLGYILLTAVAADQLSVYAMRLDPDFSIEIIVPAFCITGPAGRARALLTFINITRWIRTVAKLSLLPLRSTLPMFQPVMRPSPFQGECPASEHTTLEMHLRSMRKEFLMPRARLQNLLDVYGLLNSGSIPGAISCTRIQVDGQEVVLKAPEQEAPPSKRKRNKTQAKAVLVKLTLRPVAAALHLPDNAALRRMCDDVLGTLEALHARGFVHRDVRDANILRDTARFLLIDWELAARIGSPVFWQAAQGRLPPDVHSGTAWQPWMDLWQLGQAMQAQRAAASPESEIFAAKLRGKHFTDAAEARASLW